MLNPDIVFVFEEMGKAAVAPTAIEAACRALFSGEDSCYSWNELDSEEQEYHRVGTKRAIEAAWKDARERMEAVLLRPKGEGLS